MATRAQTDARNTRLRELLTAVREWHESERTRLENEVEFMKSVLRGRTGAERLRAGTATELQGVVANELQMFLAGG